MQAPSQSSPPSRLPSSHCSKPARMPSPQATCSSAAWERMACSRLATTEEKSSDVHGTTSEAFVHPSANLVRARSAHASSSCTEIPNPRRTQEAYFVAYFDSARARFCTQTFGSAFAWKIADDTSVSCHGDVPSRARLCRSPGQSKPEWATLASADWMRESAPPAAAAIHPSNSETGPPLARPP